MNATKCSKCGSQAVLPDVPVVTSVDNLSSVPVVAVAYSQPDAWLFKGPVTHRFLARVCGDCGFAEFYVENPQALAAAIQQGAVPAQKRA
jgi:predicted nucleic-acid-binding Zn-ribbon protein